jgi:predicted nucleic-acid-binding Zn-ribbon protein
MPDITRDIRRGVCPLCEHNEVIEQVQPRYPNGVFQVYSCRRCGYSQWFLANPSAVEIGPQHRTRIVRGPSAHTPYR